jgi:UDP-N-acetylglucosamine:LPS N-acetylglucosamine transferase
LSRFNVVDREAIESEESLDVLCIVSGPEPQRSIFEDILSVQLKASNLSGIMIQGKPGDQVTIMLNEKVRVYNHLPTNVLLDYMLNAKHIICRPGYSGIMDLVSLGLKAIFVPTPGQTEQEYLAIYHKSKNQYYSVNQSEFKLDEAINMSKGYDGLHIEYNSELLDRAIDELISRI